MEFVEGVFHVLGQLVTWLLVVLGWAVVSNLQDYRELRKDRVSRVSELRKRLLEFEMEALRFHTSEFDFERMLSLGASVSALGRELHFLQACRYLDVDYGAQFVALRKACTDQNFDRSKHSALDASHPLCLVIRTSRDSLDAALMEAQIAVTTAGRTPLDVLASVLAGVGQSIAPLWRRFRQWLASLGTARD